MNCETVEDFLSSAQLNDLKLAPDNLMLHHAKQCLSCQTKMVAAERYLRTLESLEEPELGAVGRERILDRFKRSLKTEVKTNVKPAVWWQPQGFALGFVTASMLCVAMVLLMLPRDQTHAPVATLGFERPVHQQNISLLIEVPLEMTQANLILEFPSDLRWRGLEEMERIEWPVNLQKGENILELPVSYTLGERAKKTQVITASIRYGDTSRSFSLPVSLSTQLSGREKQTEFSL